MKKPDKTFAKLLTICEALYKKLEDQAEEDRTDQSLLIQMTRINAQMFDGTVRVLMAMNEELTKQNSELLRLLSENVRLRGGAATT